LLRALSFPRISKIWSCADLLRGARVCSGADDFNLCVSRGHIYIGGRLFVDWNKIVSIKTYLNHYSGKPDEMNINSLRSVLRFILASILLMSGSVFAASDAPSRSAVKDCKWVKLSNESAGLAAWVQQCDFGFRKIDFIFQEKTLAIRFSDGGKPEPVIDVMDLLPYETLETGLRRIYFAHTEKSIAKRCVLSVYPGSKLPEGAKRYTFLPNAEYKRELTAKAKSDEIGEPPCGEWGEGPEGVQYFEVWPQSKVRKALFVREGQDEPLFDAMTLSLIAPH
jgi:hypothetical protein